MVRTQQNSFVLKPSFVYVLTTLLLSFTTFQLWQSACSIGVPSLPEARAASSRPTLPRPLPQSPSSKTVHLHGPTKACPTSNRTKSLLPKHPTLSCLPFCSMTSTTPRVLPTQRWTLPTPTSCFRMELSTEVLGGVLMRLTALERPVYCCTSLGWQHLM